MKLCRTAGYNPGTNRLDFVTFVQIKSVSFFCE